MGLCSFSPTCRCLTWVKEIVKHVHNQCRHSPASAYISQSRTETGVVYNPSRVAEQLTGLLQSMDWSDRCPRRSLAVEEALTNHVCVTSVVVYWPANTEPKIPRVQERQNTR